MSTSISDHAYAELAQAIATCRLPPGSPIHERTDAARLGMSRTPFRQALHRLALEGLVISVPKRGTYVTPLDAADVEHNTHLSEAIEVEMAELILLDPSGLDLGALAVNMASQAEAIRSGDRLSFLRLDEDFHGTILTAAGNPRAIESAQRCRLHINRVSYIAPMDEESMVEALRQHRRIVSALQGQDPSELRAAIHAHLQQPLERLAQLAAQMPGFFQLEPGNRGLQ
jgi:DNA-binding GntR family transcriptional regulator